MKYDPFLNIITIIFNHFSFVRDEKMWETGWDFDLRVIHFFIILQ